jgi:autotransporter strand-loop-strand O-heptosyltransferase
MKKNAPFFKDLVKRKHNYLESEPEILISFDYGARVDIVGYSSKLFRVEFWDDKGIVYSTEIGTGHFAAPSKKYFTPWHVKVFDGKKLLKEHKLQLKGKRVYVFMDTNSLGDNLAWMPQIERFREATECELCLTTFYNGLFEKHYPQIKWNQPGSALDPFDYKYVIGYHIYDDKWEKTPTDPRTIPLGRVPCEILGIPYVETRPILESGFKRTIPEKYVCIAVMSTAGAKLWQRENGWQEVIDHLHSIGLKTVVIQKEPTTLERVVDMTGNLPLENRMGLLEHCEFFIGLGSGLSWLAWAMKKKVILISGFSDAFSEFQLDCERIINKDVCNSCWNDVSVKFDKGDWNWCPRLKGTDRQFECTREIGSERVIQAVNKLVQ